MSSQSHGGRGVGAYGPGTKVLGALVALVALAGATVAADPPASWAESFESYTAGTQLHGQNGWQGWDNDLAWGALVTDAQTHGGSKAVAVAGASDLVHQFNATAGCWTFTAWQYVPVAFSGTTYIIMLNAYQDGGGCNWSTQVAFDAGSGRVHSDDDGAELALVRGRWVQIRVEIDLDNDVQRFFYDGQVLYEKSWIWGVSGWGARSIAALDLYANGASSVYYDDVSLVPVGTLPPPVITPPGGTFSARQTVTIAPVPLSELAATRGWRNGTKYPGQGVESVAALSHDGQGTMALRAHTSSADWRTFRGVNMSREDGAAFPFFIWSLTDFDTGYPPDLFGCATDAVEWDGSLADPWYGETGNRVFLILFENTHGTGLTWPVLFSCAAGVNQDYDSQTLAAFAPLAVSSLASQGTMLEVVGDYARVLVGDTPLVSDTTDADGWVSYLGDEASGRVTTSLGPTRFWVTLAGGYMPGEREVVLADTPAVTVRYTSDGSPVTETSPLVTDPLRLTYDVTLRARSFSLPQYASAEAVATFTSAIPYLPAESYVAPLYLAMDYAPLDGSPPGISVSGPSGTVSAGPAGDLSYPLSATEPTPLVLHRSGQPDVTQSVRWKAIDLGSNPVNGQIQIVKGESLLLTAGTGQSGALHVEVLAPNGQADATGDGTAGDKFPFPFNSSGTFSAFATLNAVSVGLLTVKVVAADFQGPIACEVGFTREKDVLTPVADSVVFTAQDPTLLEVSVKENITGGQRLYLKPLKAGNPVLQARLGTATGRVIASQVIDEFVLDTQAKQFIGVIQTFPDGSLLVQTNLEMTPMVENLGVRLHIFVSGVTFADSTLDQTINTTAFTLDSPTGKYLHPYQMIMMGGIHTGPCHTIAVYQNNVQVGQ